MRFLSRFGGSLLVASSLAVLRASDASACGGCFHIEQGESTQVTGHRMVLSISKTQTTLWDQIKYAGNPSSFAWVLPTKGLVNVGLSSDALFDDIAQNTQVSVNSPSIDCPSCATASATSGGGPDPAGDHGVTVVASEVVGPYQTVQLKADDPAALETWLSDNGYALPADVKPIVDAYVVEGFGFLALKLVPGQGVDSMRPVRVTSPGAGPVLPLRMVAAGTGAITPVTLWVFGEGRYEAANAPNVKLDESALVWDWDSQKSNYAEVVQKQLAASKNKGWLVEAGEPASTFAYTSPLTSLVESDPSHSGYGDPNDPMSHPVAEVQADVDTLFAGIDPSSLWVTRLHAELSKDALAADLQLGVAADQSPVNRYHVTPKTTGTQPMCPPDPCDGLGGASGAGAPSGQPTDVGGSGCSVQTRGGGLDDALAAALGISGLALLVARRRRS